MKYEYTYENKFGEEYYNIIAIKERKYETITSVDLESKAIDYFKKSNLEIFCFVVFEDRIVLTMKEKIKPLFYQQKLNKIKTKDDTEKFDKDVKHLLREIDQVMIDFQDENVEILETQ